jgi:hypothetical protein
MQNRSHGWIDCRVLEGSPPLRLICLLFSSFLCTPYLSWTDLRIPALQYLLVLARCDSLLLLYRYFLLLLGLSELALRPRTVALRWKFGGVTRRRCSSSSYNNKWWIRLIFSVLFSLTPLYATLIRGGIIGRVECVMSSSIEAGLYTQLWIRIRDQNGPADDLTCSTLRNMLPLWDAKPRWIYAIATDVCASGAESSAKDCLGSGLVRRGIRRQLDGEAAPRNEQQSHAASL